MRCPFCSEVVDRVFDSRSARDHREIRRRRECLECGRRFTTREKMEEILPKIVKRDKRREEYDRLKIEHSLQKACAKRPVSEDELQLLVDNVEHALQEVSEAEISTDFVGLKALEGLVLLDKLAAARFASVFRSFESAEDYEEFFASLQKKDLSLIHI